MTTAKSSGDSKIVSIVENAKRKRPRAPAGLERTEPREGGFDVEAMNERYGLVLMGSKAVIVSEQADGPMEDRLACPLKSGPP